ncbi:MAG: prephenate dehydrogenase/arogenate dehydrogenase family protein [Acidobacteria bacterium]|nr:prephenate dehydrogenase/arogenate dehydrogenase family protein [Acidobacteriota bacterium]
MKTVAIVGVGLIGGSFALALRKAGFTGAILGVSSPATLERALARGVISEGLPLAEAVSRAGLVYLSQPIAQILAVLPEIERYASPGTLVTDAGSTKREIVEQAARIFTNVQFLGGHPMAGKESRGVESADADLFRHRSYVLTPRSESELHTDAASEFREVIQSIGARLVVIDAALHDRIVAHTSHLPQLASTALAAMLSRRDIAKDSLYAVAGPGLRDQTRLALSPFDVWRDILDTNHDEVVDALTAYIDELTSIRGLLESPRMGEVFRSAENFARELRQGRD